MTAQMCTSLSWPAAAAADDNDDDGDKAAAVCHVCFSCWMSSAERALLSQVHLMNAVSCAAAGDACGSG